MDIFVSDLHEDRTRLGEQLSGQGELFQHLVKVAVDPPLVGVAEGADHLGVGGQTLAVFLGFALPHRHLKVGFEADPVGRVEKDHLHLPGQAFPTRQRRHHPGRFAVDEPVLPVAGVPIPFVGGFGR